MNDYRVSCSTSNASNHWIFWLYFIGLHITHLQINFHFIKFPLITRFSFSIVSACLNYARLHGSQQCFMRWSIGFYIRWPMTAVDIRTKFSGHLPTTQQPQHTFDIEHCNFVEIEVESFVYQLHTYCKYLMEYLTCT